MQRYIVTRGSAFEGDACVPGDKSVSHRAVMLGAIAEGTTEVRGFLNGDDCLATVAAFRQMGVRISSAGESMLSVEGVGPHGLSDPPADIDLGNSGTSIRLLTGLLAGQGITATLTGDSSLTARPMERVAEPLRRMGARIRTSDGRAPIRIDATSGLTGIDCELPVPSAQLKSAVLLAGLGAAGTTTVRSPGPSRDHTERMLSAFGVPVESDAEGQVVSLVGPAALSASRVEVPGDLSSAAFLIVAAAIGATGPVTLRRVGINPTRDGVLRVLDAMGARIDVVDRRDAGGEPVADLHVARSDLVGIDVPADWVPLAIDEVPVLCVAAAAASGTTRIVGAEELRHKETDRLSAMAAALSSVGIDVEEAADGLTIVGGPMRSGIVDAREDHRIAMSMAIAALAADGPIEIRDTDNVATSFPSFAETVRSLGLKVDVDRLRAA